MQTRLRELPDPSLDDVVKAALAMDAATKDAGEISRVASTEAVVNKMKHNSGPQEQPGSSPGSTPAPGKGRRRKWRRGSAAAGSGSSAARLNVAIEHLPILDMWHTDLVPPSVPPYVLTVQVCRWPISMELDTGASVSVMAGKTFKRSFPGVAVEVSDIMLRSYSGELSQVQCQAMVSVCFGNREATLLLYLTRWSSLALLGRNWICALGIRLPGGQEAAIHGVQDIPSLLTEFQSLFKPEVGTFAGTTAGIRVPEGVQPWFFKPHPLPFALKDGVTLELQRLQREGIKTAQCAAPIVLVPKRGGSVTICGDFKVTITPSVTIKKYSLPRIEDLWWFLPNLSVYLQPVHILLRYGQHWAWKKEQDMAFEHCKQLITKAPVLVHLDPAKSVVLTVDASPYGVEAVLVRRDNKDGHERPMSFASRRLHTAEQRYSQLNKDDLALMYGVEHFQQYLRSRKFKAVMDHEPRLGLLGSDKAVPVQASPREYNGP
ncbi:uncharacterized protein LOC142814475 [Rhipicephalus microplus]|uniref:uncharacterized protein LOC142814475 n=1 Tax=Rhipicephalus microplus TaxID=6941 RepID=UPI003F6D6BFE